ncbi:gtp pyrophosphokinase, (p)ppgpp synthetase i [hydrocarbon metagenome]|uniref:Gtp pyrophosphokinase, (P)ppgpp synthetase i n=1 Tax=hydrocarbon metagenome TaxID=938273 RepID=A0A0W8E153_9ZZZZ
MTRVFRIERACELASQAHAGQVRKGTNIPYITHPMAVGIILAEAGATTDAVIAGIIHDVVEDSHITLEEVEMLFGNRVRTLVEACSELDKSLPWEERKNHTLQSLQDVDRDIWLTTLADKLNNIRTMLRDHAICGEEIWSRFNRGRQEQEWYYRGLVTALRQNRKYLPCMFNEFEKLVDILFKQS